MSSDSTTAIDDAETVKEVLDSLQDQEDVWPMTDLVYGVCNAEDLHFEDWVRPLELTDGQICLRLDPPRDREPVYVSWNNGEIHRMWPYQDRPVESSPGFVKLRMPNSGYELSPVLRSETPFEANGGAE